VEPADAESVVAVGAIRYSDWETGPQEDFSSQGPTNAWAGSGERIKPDISGPDGVTLFTFDPFLGTSASTPHVAGAAALLLSMYPESGPDELEDLIESSAVDMGDPGKDNLYGWGRLEMDFNSLNNGMDPDKDSDQIPDNWEDLHGLDFDDPNDATYDPDNDGYSNLMEFLAGTDPYDADSDDDGISDGDEDVNQNQILDTGETHALWQDTDGDGINDGDEVNEDPSSSGNNSGGGGGGCFIATAAFGSPMEPRVKVLSEFRDNILLISWSGKIFVNYYYKYSPPVADYIAKNDTLNTLARGCLMPLIWISWLTLHFGPYKASTVFIVLLSVFFIVSLRVFKGIWNRRNNRIL
jgi:hypothetical protein